MAEVRAFRGVRYGAGVGEELGRLIAPPYDVTLPDLIARLRERSPYNMVHLEHVRPDPGHDPHAWAARQYRAWRQRGLLVRDDQPALYRYDHTFAVGGERLTRRGIFAAVGLAPWAERIVLPHEATFPGPVRERTRRLRAVQANLSPIYLLYRDPGAELRALLAATDDLPPDVEAEDPDGECHRLTALRDPDLIGGIGRFFAGRRLYVADGHHRYEAALAYRSERRSEGGIVSDPNPDGAGAHDFILALLSDADDPSVVILPTHRLVHGLPEVDPAAVRAALAERFLVAPVGGEQPEVGDAVCLARFAGATSWWRVSLRPDAPHAALMPADRSPAWRRLGTAVLGSVILERILGIDPPRLTEHVGYTHDAATAARAVERGEAQIAFLVAPSGVDDLIAVAEAGDKMPAKSTYFWPKVPAGLVIHELG